MFYAKIKDKMKPYYRSGAVMPCEEDWTHEFKGHRNLQVEEVPDTAFEDRVNKQGRTRKAVSEVLNGFLNSGFGGTAYLGVLDDGTIRGLHMTQAQKNHTRRNLRDLMGRYTPPVERHRYHIKFIPVLQDEDMSQEQIRKQVDFDNLDASKPAQEEEHLLRTSRFCKCDIEANAQHSHHIILPAYVVEIRISPWDAADTRNEYPVGQMRAHPLHQDETGAVRLRRHAMVEVLSMTEVAQYSKTKVTEHYQKKIDKMKREIRELKKSSSGSVTSEVGSS